MTDQALHYQALHQRSAHHVPKHGTQVSKMWRQNNLLSPTDQSITLVVGYHGFKCLSKQLRVKSVRKNETGDAVPILSISSFFQRRLGTLVRAIPEPTIT